MYEYGDSFELWYKVGGGGGHELYISEPQIEFIFEKVEGEGLNVVKDEVEDVEDVELIDESGCDVCTDDCRFNECDENKESNENEGQEEEKNERGNNFFDIIFENIDEDSVKIKNELMNLMNS
jgi:hypothetical protein